MTDIDDITSAIKSGKAKDSGVVKPPVTFKLRNTFNENESLRQPKGGVDQGMAKPRDDSYKGLKEFLGADKDFKMKPMKKGGSVSSASKRADGCCVRGKTKGKMM